MGKASGTDGAGFRRAGSTAEEERKSTQTGGISAGAEAMGTGDSIS